MSSAAVQSGTGYARADAAERGVAAGRRVDAIDTIRAGAMMIGVLFHACAPYMHAPMRNFVMPLQQESPRRWIDGLFWLVHASYMPAFFVVAGFVGFLYLRRRGANAYIANRTRRLLVPMALSIAFVLPAMYVVWGWGWVERGWASWRNVAFYHFGPDIERNLFGLMHLWFIEYLFVYAAAVWFVAQSRALCAVAAWIARPWLVIGLPIAAACAAADSGWFLDFRTAFVPDWRMLTYYGCFFAWGCAIGQSFVGSPQAGLRPFTRWWPVALIGAAGTGAWLLREIFGSTVMTSHGLREGMVPAWTPAAWRLSIALVLFASTATWAVIGVFVSKAGAAGPVRRFLVDAAYWTYLTHLFWVGLGVMLLHWTPLVPELKVLIVTAFAWAGSLMTFKALRRTWVGNLVGASRSSTALVPASSPSRHQTSAEAQRCTS